MELLAWKNGWAEEGLVSGCFVDEEGRTKRRYEHDIIETDRIAGV